MQAWVSLELPFFEYTGRSTSTREHLRSGLTA